MDFKVAIELNDSVKCLEANNVVIKEEWVIADTLEGLYHISYSHVVYILEKKKGEGDKLE